MRIGALVADADGVDLDRFHAFGFFLGAAFQIQDDLLNLTGDAAATARRSAATSGRASARCR